MLVLLVICGVIGTTIIVILVNLNETNAAAETMPVSEDIQAQLKGQFDDENACNAPAVT